MSAQSLLHSVFSCSSPASGGAASAKGFSKRKLRQTRSLDPALIGHCGGEASADGEPGQNAGSSALGASGGRLCSPPPLAEGLGPRSASSPRGPTPRALCSSFSTPSTPQENSPSGSFHFDYEVPLGRGGLKKSMAWDLPSAVAGPGSGRSTASILCSSGGGPNGIFTSPRRWLQQRKFQPTPNSRSHSYVVWKSEGDFTWNSMSSRSVRLRSVPIQSLSELERARLQEVAFYQLQQDCDLSCQITIPKDGQKRKKSLRKKLDSLGKEKNKDREFIPQAFGMPLSQVIANDRAYKLKQDSQRDEQKDATDFVTSLLPFGNKRQNKELSSSNSSLSSTSETPNESTSPNTPEPAPRARRRGAMSVDSITDLDDNQSRLLEALQLSLPAEAQNKKEKARDKKLSLNPIYRQVPRLVDSCCQHLEKHGKWNRLPVPPDLQNEVLISLLETDPDVVDYLLRRKASQSSNPDILRSEVSFSMGGRHSSTDSKASSGDISPYDNNSPVLSERSLLAMQEDTAPGGSEKLYKVPEQYMLVGHLQAKSRESSPGPRLGKDMSEEPFNIWGTWHSTLKSGSKDPGTTGSYGDIFESSSLRPGLSSLSQGNLSPNWPPWQGSSTEWEGGTQAARRTRATASSVEGRAHPPVSRVCSTPHIQGSSRGAEQATSRSEQSLALSSAEDCPEWELDSAWLQRHATPLHQRPQETGRNDPRPPPPYPGPGKQASVSSQQPPESPPWRLQRPVEGSGRALEEGGHISKREHQATPKKLSSAYSISASGQNSENLGGPNWLDWQKERWQIWELLSTDNPDGLPETLV
ncbi:rho GTPase-activating protein 6 [Choloepus didactylus]|uniref:rho GTPase-activating protein 6 n=1 Tax=Choloepus didactylus TaxID=27675 RepID=UPI00189EE229|nr:rho GTPase-activating protein 6 [Choloepus didactylus]